MGTTLDEQRHADSLSKRFWGEKMTIKELIFAKLTSGRFLFTMVAALVFAYLSIRGRLPVDKIMEVVLIIIYAYFSRQDRSKKEDGK